MNKTELINFISNIKDDYQSIILSKLYLYKSKDKEIYLNDYIFKENEIVITMSGAKNANRCSKLAKRNRYTIIFNKSTNKFNCNCKDSIYRYNTICKHISYLICKIGNIFDHNFFETKILNTINLKKFISSLKTQTIISFIPKETNNQKTNKELDKVVRMPCVICYEIMENEIVQCPSCKNTVHTDCMNNWLDINKCATCVFCRSDIWELF